ncbi:MAG: hypothetical protein E6R04_07975 [Spirochaetes bacterium]|nr:MAG: hypothetical protein E6R04_07975 [Spirochaetota bacterium]
MIVYRPSDRIAVKVGELTVWISPLSYEEKTNLLSTTKMVGGKAVSDAGKMSYLTLKYSIKKVEGLESCKFADGSPCTMEFGADGYPTDESLETLLAIFGNTTSAQLSSSLVLGNYKNTSIEGVEFIGPESKKKH